MTRPPARDRNRHQPIPLKARLPTEDDLTRPSLPTWQNPPLQSLATRDLQPGTEAASTPCLCLWVREKMWPSGPRYQLRHQEITFLWGPARKTEPLSRITSKWRRGYSPLTTTSTTGSTRTRLTRSRRPSRTPPRRATPRHTRWLGPAMTSGSSGRPPHPAPPVRLTLTTQISGRNTTKLSTTYCKTKAILTKEWTLTTSQQSSNIISNFLTTVASWEVRGLYFRRQ